MSNLNPASLVVVSHWAEKAQRAALSKIHAATSPDHLLVYNASYIYGRTAFPSTMAPSSATTTPPTRPLSP